MYIWHLQFCEGIFKCVCVPKFSCYHEKYRQVCAKENHSNWKVQSYFYLFSKRFGSHRYVHASFLRSLLLFPIFLCSQYKIPLVIQWHPYIWYLSLVNFWFLVGDSHGWVGFWLDSFFVQGSWKYSKLVILGGFRLLDKVMSFDISIMISAQRWKIYWRQMSLPSLDVSVHVHVHIHIYNYS